jgi:hypothetical protein
MKRGDNIIMNQSETEAIAKAVAALKEARHWVDIAALDQDQWSAEEDLEKVDEAIAALTALQESPAPVGVKSGIVEKLRARLASASINERRYERPMTWEEADELLSALQPSPTREEAEALVKELRGYREFHYSGGGGWYETPEVCTQAAAFIARYHLGEKS